MASRPAPELADPPSPKFGVLRSADDPQVTPLPFRHSDQYEIQQTSGPQRLALAPAADPVALLKDLAAVLPGPFGMLYVLTLSRLGEAEPGRYQSPDPIDGPALGAFLDDFAAFLAGDARHALWIISLGDGSQLVYDRHEIVYAYGPLDRFIRVAAQRGLTEGRVVIPAPHCHSYNAGHDADERRMLGHWDWIWFHLAPGDDD